MTTTVTKTISLSGTPDFSTLQSWEAACPANLVTVDQIWQGTIALPTDNFSGTSGTLLTLSGTTTDATRYIELTTASGASFRDNANVQTNALMWNSSNGCSLTNSGSYGITVNASTQPNFHMSKLQLQATTNKTSCFAGGIGGTTDGCIFEAVKTSVITIPGGTSVISNCLVVLRGSGVTECTKLQYGTSAYNCTFVTPSDVTKPSQVMTFSGAPSLKNCAMFWGTALKSGGLPTYTTSGNDNASPPSGVTQFTYNTSLFQNISDSTRDYRLVSGSGLIGAGTVDNTNAPVDIAGTTRGASNDIGCWQFVSAADTLWAQSCM